MTTKKYVAPDTKKVLVTYPDKTTRETTVGELRTFFGEKGESKEWQENFFNDLTTKLEAYGKFAKYEIILDAREMSEAEANEWQALDDNSDWMSDNEAQAEADRITKKYQ